ELGLEGRCRSMFLSEEDLRTAYRHALVFVYPSVYEGFGLPILEAFSQDCPVCLSEASCFPEIAGDAGRYFDPTDLESMRSAVAEVIASPALRSSLVSAGRERLQHFSWAASASAHLALYRSLLDE
ncbi:MAG: glycosyltransferase, partial [Bacteroidales bacterium]|nr:glycosyltransferase [Bacteroidales bacterium]